MAAAVVAAVPTRSSLTASVHFGSAEWYSTRMAPFRRSGKRVLHRVDHQLGDDEPQDDRYVRADPAVIRVHRERILIVILVLEAPRLSHNSWDRHDALMHIAKMPRASLDCTRRALCISTLAMF